MKQILLQPYPLTLFHSRKREILFGITTFLIGFQLIFQPFHFRFYSLDDKLFVLLAYTIVSMIVLSINLWMVPRVFPKWFTRNTWYLWKEMLWVSWNIFGIATGIFVFKISFGYYGFNGIQVAHGALAALAVGVIPALIYELLVLLPKGMKEKIIIARKKPKNLSTIIPDTIFYAERNQSSLSIDLTQLLFITSEKNYLIFYLLENGKLAEKKLRNRLYYAENQIKENANFFRCHRAFIINLNHIESLDLSAHGGKITLAHYSSSIPVSRRFVPELKKISKTKGIQSCR